MKTPILFSLCILFSVSLPAQQTDSISDSLLLSTDLKSSNKKYLSIKSLAIPVSFAGIGFATIHTRPLREMNKGIRNSVQESMPGFATKIDDYLKSAPAVTLFALSAAGVKGKHQLLGKTIIFLVSTELCSEVIKRLKHASNHLRPDGSTYNSFPSGHTATAFVGAEMIHQEYGARSAWYSIVGYTMAGSTGVLRVLNNRHWLGDVIAGAGIGILCTKIGYWAFSKIEKKKPVAKTIIY